MKKGKWEIEGNKIFVLANDKRYLIDRVTTNDLKDLRDCIDEVLGEDCPHKKSALSKSTRWGTRKICNSCGQDWKKEWSQPLKEEKGECNCSNPGCPRHQEKETEKKCCPCKGDYVSEFCRGECICHHETEKEPVSKCCNEPVTVAGNENSTRYYICKQCLKNCDVHTWPFDEMIGDEDELLEPEYENEKLQISETKKPGGGGVSPKKLPSERIDEITIEKIAVNLQDVLGGKNPIVQGAKIEAVIQYLDETVKDQPKLS